MVEAYLIDANSGARLTSAHAGESINVACVVTIFTATGAAYPAPNGVTVRSSFDGNPCVPRTTEPNPVPGTRTLTSCGGWSVPNSTTASVSCEVNAQRDLFETDYNNDLLTNTVSVTMTIPTATPTATASPSLTPAPAAGDIGANAVALNAASNPFPAPGEAVVFDFRGSIAGAVGGDVTMTAALSDGVHSDLDCGVMSIPQWVLTTGPLNVNAICTIPTTAQAGTTYAPVVRVNPVAWVDTNTENNRVRGGFSITVASPQSFGNVLVSSHFTTLVEGSLYDAVTGRFVANAVQLPLGHGLAFNIPAGSYRMFASDVDGVPVVDASGARNYVVEISGATANLDVPIACLAGTCIALTVPTPALRSAAMALASISDARGRVVREAEKAVGGPAGPANSPNFTPNGGIATMLSTFNYAVDDPGAWAAGRAAYTFGGNIEVSCADPVRVPPCYLQWDSSDLRAYSTQNDPAPRVYRGGQCKFACDLILNRSGVRGTWSGSRWSFQPLPPDLTIAGYPLYTRDTAQPGDVLRRTSTTQHAAIVVYVHRKSGFTDYVLVVDSNWAPPPGTSGSGNGYEIISVHRLYFAGVGGVTDAGTYHLVTCIYTGAC
ncbi:MAG: hypothetical protein ACHQ9S_22500 [Candidatus Binatia bacterium]